MKIILPFLYGLGSAQMFKKVKLKDVDTLTLYQGKMTNGRRSSPVPQLTCRGGSAGCNAFVPDVVQCYNRGSDGLDTQWECKTEMPNEYKFGKVQVSCEGYEYPEDPYVLAGSCGLEYTIDRTGVNQGKSNSNSWGSSYSSNGWNNGNSYEDSEGSSIFFVIFLCFVGYILYKAIFDPTTPANQPPPYNPDFIPPAGTEPPPYSASPPHAGANANAGAYAGANAGAYAGAYDGAYDGAHARNSWFGGRNSWFRPRWSQRRSGNSGWNNWTAFGTGWMANDWFKGNTRDTTYQRRRSSPNRESSNSGSSSSSSSGTRTTSGFGGTSRR